MLLLLAARLFCCCIPHIYSRYCPRLAAASRVSTARISTARIFAARLSAAVVSHAVTRVSCCVGPHCPRCCLRLAATRVSLPLSPAAAVDVSDTVPRVSSSAARRASVFLRYSVDLCCCYFTRASLRLCVSQPPLYLSLLITASASRASLLLSRAFLLLWPPVCCCCQF
ncbi:hypothetical protein PLICRDRAFT_281029 [Plicaturopsis crispa FD-325 SS-3]|nr:hypothetical protein PLICRDRAFT_281029 [Plicaturopsis crispa FD-325 SS-3]